MGLKIGGGLIIKELPTNGQGFLHYLPVYKRLPSLADVMAFTAITAAPSYARFVGGVHADYSENFETSNQDL
jgi:hypothetical protein